MADKPACYSGGVITSRSGEDMSRKRRTVPNPGRGSNTALMSRLRLAILLVLPLAACRGPQSDPDAFVGDDDVEIDAGPGMPDGPPPDGEPEPVEEVVQCPSPWPAPTEGSCDVVEGTGTAVLVRGNVLGATTAFLDGEVLYDGDEFVCRGCDCSSSPGFATATVITCAGAAVSPGLIDAHDHITFNNAFPLTSTLTASTRYINRRAWRGPVSTPSNAGGTSATGPGMRWNEFRHLFGGTTSDVGSGHANNLMRNLDDPSAADAALGFGALEYQVFILNDTTSNNSIPANCGFNYEFTDTEVAAMDSLVTHTSEGLDAYAREEFRCVASQLVGRDFVEPNAAHIHAIALDAPQYYDMARDDSVLIWSPRSNISLYGNTAEPQVMRRVGGTIAIGTDWTYSGSASVPRELACAASFDDAYLGDAFTDKQLWEMATINAAKATRKDALIGSIEPGKIADLTVFRAAPGVTHGAVIGAWSDDVLLTVRDGDVLFGEADVVAELDGTCETLDVCGETRRVCAMRELGVTYASVASAIAADPDGPIFPAVLCEGDPVFKEPTCVPSRPGEYTGAITAGDPDGDGLVDAADNCPTVFNPKRAVDGNAQPDSDDDGAGDACDPTPIGSDLDGDAVDNATDVCPFVSDDQTDADSDGKGAACEICDDVANPDTVCADAPVDPVTIVEIQNGTVPTDSSVSVTGAVVTSKHYNGFTMQDTTVTNGQYAGIFVFTGGVPTVSRGEIVAVTGKVVEYPDTGPGLTEITGATIVSHTPGGTLPAPIALTVTAATAEMYESVLVSLTDLSTINLSYNCTADQSACGDTAAASTWLLNSTILAWDAAYEGTEAEWDAEGAALAASEPFIGVIGYRYGRVRITPRIASDIGN